ncbi:hypothetical protein, partial [Actinorugispora endophytica]|uniref:hypothetical protein n=1 Tax=Actinorugispora endophytica TaxID=1605990 RepID=UPI001AAD8322
VVPTVVTVGLLTAMAKAAPGTWSVVVIGVVPIAVTTGRAVVTGVVPTVVTVGLLTAMAKAAPGTWSVVVIGVVPTVVTTGRAVVTGETAGIARTARVGTVRRRRVADTGMTATVTRRRASRARPLRNCPRTRFRTASTPRFAVS